MLFDQSKFVNSILALQDSAIFAEVPRWRLEQQMRERFLPYFKECVSWESDEEKEKVFDYMKKYGVQSQVERDFSPRRQHINGQVLYVPAYEMWTAADALLMLMTYRNSPKLVQATVLEHRNFIQEVAGNLLPDQSIAWVYKDPSEFDRLLDSGYSYMTFPVVARGALFFEYLCQLQLAQKRQEKQQDEMNTIISEVQTLSSHVTKTLSQLQAV